MGKVLSILIFCGVLLLALGLSSCENVDVIRYEHAESLAFEKNYDFEASEFSDHGIVFTVVVRPRINKTRAIWLSLYSKAAGKSVDISHATLTIVNENTIMNVNQIATIDGTLPALNIFSKYILLGEVEDEVLERSLLDNGRLKLDVSYLLDGETNSMTFLLKRRVEKVVVFPT